MSPKSIRVCLSPALLPFYELDDTIAVVIDIFRATSSMCYGLANGAQAIIPVEELDECLSYQSNGHLLAAERDGQVVTGFDFGTCASASLDGPCTVRSSQHDRFSCYFFLGI